MLPPAQLFKKEVWRRGLLCRKCPYFASLRSVSASYT